MAHIFEDAAATKTPQRNNVRRISRLPTLGLQRGDLLFGNRLSWMQRIMVLTGDPWTHAAIVGEVDGELTVIEMGAKKGIASRSIERFVSAYRYYGVARLAMSQDCIDLVATEAEQQLRSPQLRYLMSTCALLEGVSAGRRFIPAAFEGRIVNAAQHEAQRLLDKHGPNIANCAGFVSHCLGAACPGCRPDLAIPARPRLSLLRGATTVTDLCAAPAPTPLAVGGAIAALLTAPADLWVAPLFDVREVVHGDVSTTIFDDRTNPFSLPTCEHVRARPTVREEVTL